jgi:hypothetical protein
MTRPGSNRQRVACPPQAGPETRKHSLRGPGEMSGNDWMRKVHGHLDV